MGIVILICSKSCPLYLSLPLSHCSYSIALFVSRYLFLKDLPQVVMIIAPHIYPHNAVSQRHKARIASIHQVVIIVVVKLPIVVL